MKTLNRKLKFAAIKTLPLVLLTLGIGGYTTSASASDFDWGSKCYTDTEDGGRMQIDVRGKLEGPKSSVTYDSETVTAVVQNNTGKEQKVTLVTYKEFYGHSNFKDVYDSQGNLIKLGQDVFDFETKMVPPGESRLTVDMPGCSTQIDLVCTDVIDYLGDELYGNRKLAWYHPHQPDNGWCDDGIEPPPLQCNVSLAEVTGISDGQAVEPGTTLDIGALVNGDKPKKVRFELTGPDGANITSPHDEGYNPYFYLGDSNGGVPNGWDTTGLPEGQYTMTVSVYNNNGWDQSPKESCDTQTVTFTIGEECKPEYYAVHDDLLNDTQILIVREEMEALGVVHYGHDIEALAIHPKTGVLYAASGDDTNYPGYLYTIDKTTGELASSCDVVDYDEIDGLAFHPDGTLWGWVQDVGIITIDISTCTATLVEEYLGEVEDLTWNKEGTLLYGIKNVNGNDPREGNGDRSTELLAFDGDNIASICDLQLEGASVGKEIEALETNGDALWVGFHGKNTAIVGQINEADCTITQIGEIPSIFNDIEGITGRSCK